MFAPPVAKPKTKSAASSTNKLALKRSTLAGQRFGDGAFEQRASLTGNKPGAHAQEADATAAREAAPWPSWDFSKISVFPPGRTNQPQDPFLFGGPRLPHPIQAKLKVGAVDDPLEHEADRVADQVMRMPAPEVSIAAAPPQVSRKCDACEEEENLQKKPAGPQAAAGEAPASAHEVLRSPGQPLDAAAREFMEPRFGHDFSGVRVHTGTSAEQSARDVNAHAYTVGHNMVFGVGRFAPGTQDGRRLIAHELTHVVQQERSGVAAIQCYSDATILAEIEKNVGKEDTKAQRLRIEHLTEIFSSLAWNEADNLLKRLAGRKKGDRLAAEFHNRLSTKSRQDLLGILQKKAVMVPLVKVLPADEAVGKVPVTSKTDFHPGVMHDHQPSGRWADVQKDPNSAVIIESFCKHFNPEHVLDIAKGTVMGIAGKPIAKDHLNWYLKGGGAVFVEDANLEFMLRTDSGVQAKITRNIPSGRSSGTFAGHVTISQDDYSSGDFQYAFGEIDRLDFEVDFATGTLRAWFQDRYEWHPFYPFYKKMPGDYLRPTNCVHAAAVELKSEGAKDYWMKGEIPFIAIPPAAPYKDPGPPSLAL
jgi:hypothetical protein